jgi:membrane associated rhomboid family serine protease
MVPLSDDTPTLHTPLATYALLGAMGLVWFRIQGAGLDAHQLAASVCNLGMVPGELTHLAPVGEQVPLGRGLACVVDREPINAWTPLISMFLHGSWSHLLGNALFFWVFGRGVEDAMGSLRFLCFYLTCGLAAALAQVLVDPASPLPMVGASGAISGVMGAYVILYPTVRIRVLMPFFFVWALPAWLVLLEWFGLQVLGGLPQLAQVRQASGGVAVWAHIGGFLIGALLVKVFENPLLMAGRTALLRRLR